MAKLGEQLASGSRLIFWGVVPLGALLLGLMTFTFSDRDPQRMFIVGTLDFTFLLLALGLHNPRRFAWALRSVMLIIYIFYCDYVIEELIYSGHPLRWSWSHGEVNPLNAVLGLISIGIPAGIYAVKGFAARRKRPRSPYTPPGPIHPE